MLQKLSKVTLGNINADDTLQQNKINVMYEIILEFKTKKMTKSEHISFNIPCHSKALTTNYGYSTNFNQIVCIY